MSRIPYVRRLSVLTGLAEHCWQPPPPGPPDTRAGDSMGADSYRVGGWPSFRRIVPIPFPAWVGALDNWQLTGSGGELRLARSVLRGPAEYDRRLGTCRIEVRLARGPLRPSVRMRLGIDHWSATATVLELTPCMNVRPRAAYFRAGHHLLDSLTHALSAYVPARQHLGCGAAGQPNPRPLPANLSP